MRFLLYIIPMIIPFLVQKYFNDFWENYHFEIIICLFLLSIIFELTIRLIKCTKINNDKTNLDKNTYTNKELEKKAEIIIETLKKDDKIDDYKNVYVRIEGSGNSVGTHHSEYLIKLGLITRIGRILFKPTELGDKVFEMINN